MDGSGLERTMQELEERMMSLRTKCEELGRCEVELEAFVTSERARLNEQRKLYIEVERLYELIEEIDELGCYIECAFPEARRPEGDIARRLKSHARTLRHTLLWRGRVMNTHRLLDAVVDSFDEKGPRRPAHVKFGNRRSK
jgi:hypothetical protein